MPFGPIAYAKLRNGDWGLRGSEAELRPGVVVTVRRKDCTTRRETVGLIVWRGDGMCLATIARARSFDASEARSVGASEAQQNAIQRMLSRLDSAQLDSFGDGRACAWDIENRIEKAGGFEALSRQQASEIIEELAALLDDEM